MDLSMAHITQQLDPAEPLRGPAFFERAAAVAIILRPRDGDAEVLLMRRIERADDPWSGHVSLPGGRAEPSDSDVVATARRETHEEVGLDLAACGRLLGALPAIHPVPRGIAWPLHIRPLVFELLRDDPVQPGDEAQHTFWLPLGQAASGALDGVYPYRIGPTTREFPCWRYQGEVVWGLTFGILGDLLKRLDGAAT